MAKRPASQQQGISPVTAGLIALVIIVVGTFFAYTQANPFASPYEFSAIFETAQNLEPEAPVRTAGVDVGVVTKVETLAPDGTARVTMQVEDQGLPIHEDAELKIRPRIFLEGNSFVDMRPGSPSAPELGENATIPSSQTATPVSFSEVLTTLQSDTRTDLREFFREYGTRALKGGGAEGFQRSIKYWEDAYRETSIANAALLGQQEGDLNRVLRGQARAFRALARDPVALRDLITNFNRTAAAFAREDQALFEAVPLLRDTLAVGRPALQSLNSSLPGLRNFANDLLPGVRSSRETIPAAFPFTRQARLLFSKRELRGLVSELRPTVPDLVQLNEGTVPLLNQNRALSRCTSEVLLKFARNTDWEDTGPDAGAGGQSGKEPYKLFPWSLEGLSGESREHDANSPIFRVLGLGGPETVVNQLERNQQEIFGFTAFKPNAVQPPSPLDENGVTLVPQHRPDVPCENQVPPDLHAPVGAFGGGSLDGGGGASSPVKRSEASDRIPDLSDAQTEKAREAVEELLGKLEQGDVRNLEGLGGSFGVSKLDEDTAPEAAP